MVYSVLLLVTSPFQLSAGLLRDWGLGLANILRSQSVCFLAGVAGLGWFVCAPISAAHTDRM